MVDSLANPEVDAQIQKIKSILADVQTKQTVFTNTFQSLKPRERALAVKLIQANHKEIREFILGAQKFDLRAPALKFGLENIKQKYQMIMTLWRRTERLLEEAAGQGVSKEKLSQSSENTTNQAVADYARALRDLGHTPTEAMISEFKVRLDSAYQSAKEKSGGKNLNVKIVQEDGKIKVRMEPK